MAVRVLSRKKGKMYVLLNRYEYVIENSTIDLSSNSWFV